MCQEKKFKKGQEVYGIPANRGIKERFQWVLSIMQQFSKPKCREGHSFWQFRKSFK